MSDIEKKCRNIRHSIMEMIANAGGGHAGASLSLVELAACLYETGRFYKNSRPRDRFLLSKGHAGIGLYAVLAEYGILPKETLKTFASDEGPLMNHPDAHRIPGVEVSTGSLGHGLSLAVGMCLAAKLKGEEHSVFCLVGDSECHEGSVWEAAMLAGDRQLTNLCVIVDRNNLGNDGAIQVHLDPLNDKWRSFGWKTIELNGHDCQEISKAYKKIYKEKDGPYAIIANTQKGRGLIEGLSGQGPCHYIKGSKEDIIKCFLPEIREG